MAKRFALRSKTIASLVALAMVWSLGAQLKSYWGSSTALAQEHPPTVSEAATPAQQEATSAEQSKTEEHGQPEEEGALGIIFHWFNFALILGGIGYLGKKYMAPFFDQRGKAIREEMERSAQAMAEATQRLTSIEDKLQRLDEEIQELRRTALQEAVSERARIAEATKAEADKIVRAAEQEIASAAKAARRELQIYTADLAVGLAGRRIQEAITPAAEKRIFRSFVEGLHDDSKRHSGNSSSPSTASPGNHSSHSPGGA